MAKVNNKDFDLFRKTFIKYQEKLGLTSYQVYFKYEYIEDAFANICTDQNTMVSTVTLNSETPKCEKPFVNVKMSAKHEAVHLLVHELEHLARCRYLDDSEINIATEKLVNRIVKLIEEI